MTDKEKKDFIRDLHKNLYTYAGSTRWSKYYSGFIDAASDTSNMDFVIDNSYCVGYLAGTKCRSFIEPDIKIEDFKPAVTIIGNGAEALQVASYIDELYKLTGAKAEDDRIEGIEKACWMLGFKDSAIVGTAIESKSVFIARMSGVFKDDDEYSDRYYDAYTSGYKAAIVAMGKDKVEEEKKAPVKEDNTSQILQSGTTVRWKGHDGIYNIVKESGKGFYLIEKAEDTEDINGNSYTSYSYARVTKDEIEIVNEI